MDLAPGTLLREKAGMKMNEMNIIYVSLLNVLSWRVNKFLRQIELINTNVETARYDLPTIHDTFRRKYVRCKIRFRYRYCCVSVTMRPAGYLVSPHVAHGAI